MKQLNITKQELHTFIDKEIDMGTILTIKKTPIFSDDTIEMVARRHYELEINMLSLVASFIDSREKLLNWSVGWKKFKLVGGSGSPRSGVE